MKQVRRATWLGVLGEHLDQGLIGLVGIARIAHAGKALAVVAQLDDLAEQLKVVAIALRKEAKTH